LISVHQPGHSSSHPFNPDHLQRAGMLGLYQVVAAGMLASNPRKKNHKQPDPGLPSQFIQ
jgi:hypothetical protein